jgi:hypothetical protein
MPGAYLPAVVLPSQAKTPGINVVLTPSNLKIA